MRKMMCVLVMVVMLLLGCATVVMLGVSFVSIETADTMTSTSMERDGVLSLIFSIMICCCQMNVAAMSYESIARYQLAVWTAAVSVSYIIMLKYCNAGAWTGVVIVACIGSNWVLLAWEDQNDQRMVGGSITS